MWEWFHFHLVHNETEKNISWAGLRAALAWPMPTTQIVELSFFLSSIRDCQCIDFLIVFHHSISQDLDLGNSVNIMMDEYKNNSFLSLIIAFSILKYFTDKQNCV